MSLTGKAVLQNRLASDDYPLAKQNVVFIDDESATALTLLNYMKTHVNPLSDLKPQAYRP